jgi:hypothetical protein
MDDDLYLARIALSVPNFSLRRLCSMGVYSCFPSLFLISPGFYLIDSIYFINHTTTLKITSIGKRVERGRAFARPCSTLLLRCPTALMLVIPCC